jgi:hypothetical protein
LQNAPLPENRDKRLETRPASFLSLVSSFSIDDLDYLVMPYGALGSTPVFEALKRGIKVFAVKENTCALNVTASALKLKGVIEADTYRDVLARLFK